MGEKKRGKHFLLTRSLGAEKALADGKGYKNMGVWTMKGIGWKGTPLKEKQRRGRGGKNFLSDTVVLGLERRPLSGFSHMQIISMKESGRSSVEEGCARITRWDDQLKEVSTCRRNSWVGNRRKG